MTNWVTGAPKQRGTFWIAIDGAVMLVEIGPSYINRNVPDAALLVKTLGGLAYHLDSAAHRIQFHADVEWPEPPPATKTKEQP